MELIPRCRSLLMELLPSICLDMNYKNLSRPFITLPKPYYPSLHPRGGFFELERCERKNLVNSYSPLELPALCWNPS